jgi:16S rRNA (cytosine967-C5)-methyltransferase
VVDLCAGPGGKAALLSSLGQARGARLVGFEVQHHRPRLVRRSGVADVGDHRLPYRRRCGRQR